MAITRWQSWREEIDTLRHQMDQVLNNLGGWLQGEQRFHPLTKIGTADWGPSVELKETETEIVLKAQIPGVEAKDLEVQVSEDMVSIAGEHQEETQKQEGGFYHSEFQYGQFQRIIPLPVRIQHEQVKSQFKNGVLTLTLPKLQDAPRNVIKVNIEEAAREELTKDRQTEHHRQETMHTRSEQDLNTPPNQIWETAREDAVEQRHEVEQREEKMRTRAL